MAEITAALVMQLREKTGTGIMDCKRALTETAGEIEAAVDWLRKKGLAAAAKKSGRVAAEGLIGVAVTAGKAAMVEVNAETDFVARNAAFQDFAAVVAQVALEIGEKVEAIRAAPYLASGHSVDEELTQLIATVGENLAIRRACVLSAAQGVVASYVHAALCPGLGRIGVLVAIEGASKTAELETLGRQLAMQIAAVRPDAIDIPDLDPAAEAREKAILSEQARASGKSEAVIARVVEGRVRKYYEEVVLLEQIWVHDGESRVRAVLAKAGARVGGFARFALGEGIEKQGSDFAAEVAAASGIPKLPAPYPAEPG